MAHRRHRHAHCISHRIRDRDPVTIVDFDELQRLSGYRQVSKVVDWLREQKVAFVIGGDGKPRTTHDMLRTVLNGEKAEEATPIRFG